VARADGVVSNQGTYIIGRDGMVVGGGGGAPGIGRETARLPQPVLSGWRYRAS